MKNTNQDKYHIKSIGLFGSMARNTKDESGDIDIAVELESPDLFILSDIKHDIEKKFKKHVDIVRKRENSKKKQRLS